MIIPASTHSPSVIFWGYFSWDSTSELIVKTFKIDHIDYIDILNNGLIPFIKKYRHIHNSFVHDNVRSYIPVFIKS